MSAVRALLDSWRTALRAAELLGALTSTTRETHMVQLGRFVVPAGALASCHEMLADALQADALILDAGGLLDVMDREALLVLRTAINRRLDAPRRRDPGEG